MSQMSAVLDELEVSIGRRLIISRDLLPDLRAIVDDLSAPGRLDAILRSILDQPTKLERIAQNSYTHENGFDALTLLMSDKPPLSLSETYALKYWWCSPPRTGIASGRPTVWTARGTGASLCSDRCVRASL
jgi:hypothetical protein